MHEPASAALSTKATGTVRQARRARQRHKAGVAVAEIQRAKLRRLVEERGLLYVARVLELAPATVTRILCGLGVGASTRLAVSVRLPLAEQGAT